MSIKYAIERLVSRLRSSAIAVIQPGYIPNNPGERKYTSSDWRITGRKCVSTPLTRVALERWQNEHHTHLRLSADDARRLYLETRYTWPDDVYYGLNELQATEDEATERGGIYLASFTLRENGTAELLLQQTPSVLGYISFSLKCVAAEEVKALRALVSDDYRL